MSTKIIKSDVEKLVAKELDLANENNPAFHSPHEGYGVLLEEVEELQDEVKTVTQEVATWWSVVKHNDVSINDFILDGIEKYAVNAACEAVQVAAMCRKYRESLLK